MFKGNSERSFGRRALEWAALVGVVLLMVSCPAAIDSTLLSQIADTLEPVVTLDSPLEGDFYGAYTLVSGTIIDAANADYAGRVGSVFVEVPATGVSREIELEPDGSFSTVLDTFGAGYSGDIAIRIRAEDWSGNSTEVVVALRKAMADIAQFSARAANRKVELSWQLLPGATSYTIEELRHGDAREMIAGPEYAWDRLENGQLYTFRVSAEVDGSLYTSATESAIPLSPSTLAPRTSSEYRTVNLTWADIPAASEYVVERSEQRSGPYSTLLIAQSNTCADEDLPKGTGYFYRVYPVELLDDPGRIASDANYAAAGYFPEAPVLSLSLPISGYAVDVTISGTYAYVASAGNGVFIVDISDMDEPWIAGSLNTTYAEEIAVSADLACVADRSGGLRVLDISSPLAPQLVGTWPVDDAYGVAVSGDYAYVADRYFGLRIVDISTPTSPDEIGSCEINPAGTVGFLGVAVRGDYAYVADSYSGLHAVDISDKENPSLQNTCPTDRAWAVSISGDYAYVADAEYGLKICALSEPGNPAATGETITYSGHANDVAVLGTTAFVADTSYGLRAIDVSTPSSINAGEVVDARDAQGVSAAEGYVFVANYDEGLHAYNISRPESPVVAGSCTTDSARAAAVAGDYVLVADDSAGVRIVDVSDHGAPVVTGTCATDAARTVSVSGTYAYVCDYPSTLRIIDFSTPSDPVVTAWIDCEAGPTEVLGEHLFVANSSGLEVFDVGDPYDPAGVASLDIGSAYGIALSGDYAYVTLGGSGLQIVDISNPEDPVPMGSTDTTGSWSGIAVSGDYAYVIKFALESDSYLEVVDISDPADPSSVGTLVVVFPSDIAVASRYAYITEGGSLRIVDVSDPTTPTTAFQYPGVSADAIALSGRYAYVAGRSFGLTVVDLHP